MNLNTISKRVSTLLLATILTICSVPFVPSSPTPQQGPEIDVLRFRVVKGPDAQLLQMLVGEVDVWGSLSGSTAVDGGLIRPADIEMLDDAGMTITSAPGFHTSQIAFNIRPNQTYRERVDHALVAKVLSDMWFRYALFHCHDQNGLVASIYGYTVTPVPSLVPPAQDEWYNPYVPGVPYDPGSPFNTTIYDPETGVNEDACSILRFANYTYDVGESNWRTPDGELIPELKVLTPTYEVAPTTVDHAAIWIAECNAIGLMSIVHQSVEFATFLEQVFGLADFDMALVSWSLGRFVDYLYDLCHSSQDCALGAWGYNVAGIADYVIDKLVETIKYSLARRPPRKEAKITDSSGKTTFHGVFVGVNDNLHSAEVSAEKMHDLLDQANGDPYKGWTAGNKRLLLGSSAGNDKATKDNIKKAIEDTLGKAKPCEEFIFYFAGHGSDEIRQDGVKDACEDEADPKDEPNAYDNVICVKDGTISDDELTSWLSGYPANITITVILDSCYSGTFEGGSKDLKSITQKKDGENVTIPAHHLGTELASKGTTSGHPYGWIDKNNDTKVQEDELIGPLERWFNDTYPYNGRWDPGEAQWYELPSGEIVPDEEVKWRADFTHGILKGLEKRSETLKADINQDGITTCWELFDFSYALYREWYELDSDNDGVEGEDGPDYEVIDDEVHCLLIDNDGDGMLDEDPPPTNLPVKPSYMGDVQTAAHGTQAWLHDKTNPYSFAYMPLYSKNYFNAHQPGLTGIVNSHGYGSHNKWTLLNIRWQPGHPNERIEDGKTVVIWTLSEEPELLNPCYAHTVYARAIINPILDPLIAMNPYSHEDTPWIATSWESEGLMNETVTLDSNWYLGYNETAGESILFKSAGETHYIEDGMKVTFNLRTDVEWHDGLLYTPSDAEFNLEFLRNNEIPRYASMWQHIVDVQITNSTAFNVYLDTTSQWLPYDLAETAALLPPPVWNWLDGQSLGTILSYDPSTNITDPLGAGPRFGTDACPTQLYGTGPFTFQYYDPIPMYADMPANRHYFKTTQEIAELKTEMFHAIGDVDRNGEIWIGDLVRATNAFGCVIDDECYDADADLNQDGIVDMRDITLIAFFWGDKKEYP